MKRIQKRIFISHTLFQNFIISKIISQSAEEYDFRNFLITSIEGYNHEQFETVHTYSSKHIKGIYQFWKLGKFINSDFSNSQIFIPNTDGLLDYYCFNKSQKNNLKNINLYFDGILFFYPYKNKRHHLHKKRRLISRLTNLNYKFQENIFPFKSPCIENIFSILPQYTLGKELHEIIKIDLKQKYRPLVNSKETIVLTADIIKEKFLYFKNIIARITDTSNESKIVFKHHPSERDLSGYNEIMRFFEKPYVQILDNEIIESVIQKRNPQELVSYPSTALITCKLIYGNDINITCYYNNEMPDSLMSNLKPILYDLDIKIIQI